MVEMARRRAGLRKGIIVRMAAGHSQEVHGGASDEALADRVRRDADTAAFGLLVDRYRGRVIALALRMLSGRIGGLDEAEDVAQETFVAAFDRRETFRYGEKFRPWIYRIAVNRCMDRLRRQARRPEHTDLGHAGQIASDSAEPLEWLLVGEWEERLQSAVAALPPTYRAVFVLRHLDDLSYEEIAQAAGLPLGTVKTHLFRARAQLRQALSGYLDR
ncbi:MAG TPA: sigma-70 family RNA polymerase sigma factor [Capsulimonadaceae bacterium]|nr:sigma-70 family RNA polymerase sigma factor [Capsulimonadaceae bacterium]